MAYNIYFDSEQISPNYIYELSKGQNLFADEFKLGGTPMAQYKMVIDKNAIETLPSLVQIRNGTSLEETLRLDNAESEDELTITLTLVDYMSKFEFTFDASPIVPCTLLRVLQEICTQAGVTLATTSFTGSDKNINWYDSTITAREYISYIAELAGGYACMNASGELQVIPFNNTAVDTIQIADCENFKLGEQHVITRVVYDTGTGIKWEYGTTSGDTYYVDVNNVYITDESDIEAIYNVLNGYEYYSLSVDNCPINTAKIGETMAFTDGTNTYKTIVQIDQTLAGDSWFGGYVLDVKSSTQAETIVRDAKTMIKTIKTEIDREVGEISSTVSSVEESTSTIVNMLYDTNAPSLAKVYGDYDRYFSSGNNSSYIQCTYISLSDAPRPTINYGVNINVIQTIPSGRVRAIAWPNITLTAGTTYTLSCYARLSTANTGGNIGVYFCYGANPYADAGYGETYYVTSTDWTRFSWTFTADSTYFNASGKTLIYVGMFALSGTTAGGIDICNYFLQTGEPSGIDTKGSAIYQLPSDLAVLNGNVSANTEQIQTVESHVNTVQQTAENNTRTISTVREDIGNNYWTKTETQAKIQESASSITTTFSNSVTNAITGEKQRVDTMIRESGDGIAIGKSGNKIEGRFDNDSLDFVDTQDNDKKLAWVDANEGLGGSKLAVGDSSNIGNRWRIFTRQSGTHLTFTRHS